MVVLRGNHPSGVPAVDCRADLDSDRRTEAPKSIEATQRIYLLSVVLGRILRGIFYDFSVQVARLYFARRPRDRTPSRSLSHISGVAERSILRTRIARCGRAICRLGHEGDRRAIV